MEQPLTRPNRTTISRILRGSPALTLVPIIGSNTLGFIVLLCVRVGATGFLWSLACLAVGSFFGIIFGIPKEAAQTVANDPAQHSPGLRANTNMEEISDWLTKLLVGAGLVELKSLSGALAAAARYVASSLPAGSRSAMSLESIAAAIIIYFGVEGFLAGYLITRVFFQIVFRKSDDALSHRSE